MSDAFPVQSQGIADLIEALSDKQRAAFESLRAGSSFAVAAERAGAGRVTVYRWVKSDPNFRAAYNAWRQEQAESAQARLLGLADKAVDCVENALKCNDYGTAVTVLSKIGIMRRSAHESIDPQVVRMQQELEQQRELYQAAVGLIKHLLGKAGLTPQQQIEYIRQHGVDRSRLPGQRPSLRPERNARTSRQESGAAAPGDQEIQQNPQSFPLEEMAAALAGRALRDPDGMGGGTEKIFSQAG